MAFSGNRKLSNDRVSTADSPACLWMAHWSKDGQDAMPCRSTCNVRIVSFRGKVRQV
jgi:hypothetical protein